MTKGTLMVSPIAKMRPKEMTLTLECEEEPLSPYQLSSRKKIKEECDKVISMLFPNFYKTC